MLVPGRGPLADDLIPNAAVNPVNEGSPLIITLEDLTPWSLYADFSDEAFKVGETRHPFDIYYDDKTYPPNTDIKIVLKIGPSMARFASFLQPGTHGLKFPALTAGNEAAKDILFNPLLTNGDVVFYLRTKSVSTNDERGIFNIGIEFTDRTTYSSATIIYDPTVPNDGS